MNLQVEHHYVSYNLNHCLQHQFPQQSSCTMSTVGPGSKTLSVIDSIIGPTKFSYCVWDVYIYFHKNNFFPSLSCKWNQIYTVSIPIHHLVKTSNPGTRILKDQAGTHYFAQTNAYDNFWDEIITALITNCCNTSVNAIEKEVHFKQLKEGLCLAYCSEQKRSFNSKFFSHCWRTWMLCSTGSQKEKKSCPLIFSSIHTVFFLMWLTIPSTSQICHNSYQCMKITT